MPSRSFLMDPSSCFLLLHHLVFKDPSHLPKKVPSQDCHLWAAPSICVPSNGVLIQQIIDFCQCLSFFSECGIFLLRMILSVLCHCQACCLLLFPRIVCLQIILNSNKSSVLALQIPDSSFPSSV